MFIGAVGAVFAILVFSPYIAGVLQATPWTTFAGAVHYSLDYYYYLSFMAQGKLRWLTSININTQEVPSAVLYHWFYVLSGRVFATLGISDIIGYQLLVLGLTALLLYLSYRLICDSIPSQSGRKIAFILFLVSNAWPYLSRTAAGWTLGYYYSWYNYGEPFTRFSSIPHHLLAQSVLAATLLLLIRVKRIPHSRLLLSWTGFLLAGFVLASTQTPLVLVALLTCTVFWVGDIVSVRDPKQFLRAAFTSGVFPAIVMLTAGALPYTVYVRKLLGTPPYNIFAGWEALQSVHLSLIQFFQVNGPVVLLGCIGLPLFLSSGTRARRIIIVCTLISWGIFLSPVASYIGVLNNRFLSVVPTLTMACSAAVCIEEASKRVRRNLRTLFRIGIPLIILLLTLPATIQQSIARSTFDPQNGYLFLPDTVMDVNRRVENLVAPQETCFVIWPFNISFAGLTGRRPFIVSGYTTINYQAKEKLQNAFFSDATPIEQKTKILTSNGISCVVTYSFTKNLPPILTAVYTNSYMTIYRVRK